MQKSPQQEELKRTRDKISQLLDKKIFIISGDSNTREELKNHLASLGFSPRNITASNTSNEIINKIKQNIGGIDLIICHFNALDNPASLKTGFQLFKIVKEMLLKTGTQDPIPFIFIEKSFDKKEIVSALRAGASQFLIVPTDPVSLGNKLAEVFKISEDSFISLEVMGLLLNANKLRAQALFEDAIALYNKALGIGGENVEILTEKANAYFEMGDLEQAVQLYKKAIEIEANFPRAYQGLGKVYEQMGDITEAKKNFLKVLELEPQNTQVCYNLGVLCHKEGDFTTAKTFFDKGIELNKKFVRNYLGLAESYESTGKHDESMKVYREAIKFNPNQTFIYLSAGDFCLKHNLFQQAEDLFTSAINLNEDHIHLYNRLGIALRKQNKYDKAIKNYDRAIKIRPDDANLYYNQAKAYCLDGEKLIAISRLNKAFKIAPELIIEFQKDTSFLELQTEHPDKFEFN